MKSAYELAMERLAKADEQPARALSEQQKQELADIERRHKAMIAEREIFLRKEIESARERRDGEALAALEKQLVNERYRIQEEMEEAKERVRRR